MTPDSWVNFYSGSPLNRFSWLRQSSEFLNRAISHPLTRWIIFNGASILVTVNPTDSKGASSEDTDLVTALGYLRTEDVQSVLGEKPYFHVGNEGKNAENDPLAGARLNGPTIIFLGIHESSGADEASLPTVHSGTHEKSGTGGPGHDDIKGTPYFALDLAQVQIARKDGSSGHSVLTKDAVHAILDQASSTVLKKFKLVDFRIATGVFGQVESSLFAQARTIVDWNARNRFCPGCGSKQYPLWGGWKLACRSTLPSPHSLGTEGSPPSEECLSAKGLHNFAFPRTDPVIIIAIISEEGDKILLGRGRRYPPNLYSTIGGFVESGESFEDAVKREIWEECGLRVKDVKYHSSQSWPYPANLMVGYYCTASVKDRVRTDLDNELVDARWYSKEEVRAVLAHSGGAVITKKENPWFEAGQDDTHDHNKTAPVPAAIAPTPATAAQDGQPTFRVPPRTAVGGVLISDWAYDRI